MNWSSFDATNISPKKAYQGVNMLEYKEYKSKFTNITIAGLKGEQDSVQCQEKSSNIIYTWIEKRALVSQFENEMKKCSEMSKISHANILPLTYYSSVFMQEEHGNPYTKIIMLFENAEGTLYNEYKKRVKTKHYFENDTLFYFLVTAVQALAFLQRSCIKHNNISLHTFYVQKNNELKLMMNHVKRPIPINTNKVDIFKLKKNLEEIYYFAPEVYEKYNKKKPEDHYIINDYKADIFTLGMNILHLGLLIPCTSCYSAYQIDQKILNKYLNDFEKKYDKAFTEFLTLMLKIDSEIRPDFIKLEETIVNYNLPVFTPVFLGKLQNLSGDKKPLGSDTDYIPQDYVNEIDQKIQTKLKKSKAIKEKYFANGNKYSGELNSKGEFEGVGILWWANGDRYEGLWEKGIYDGEGIYFYSNGIKHYGIFSKGEINGLGVRYYLDKGIYFGDWKNGKNHGQGTFFWPSGEKYTGNFKSDQINGIGMLRWLNGWKIEGLWIDKGHGIGLKEGLEQNAANIDYSDL